MNCSAAPGTFIHTPFCLRYIASYGNPYNRKKSAEYDLPYYLVQYSGRLVFGGISNEEIELEFSTVSPDITFCLPENPKSNDPDHDN